MFAPYISVGQHGLYLQSLQNMSSYNELNAAGAQSVKAESEQEQDLAKKSNRACNISSKETAYNEQAQRRAGCYQDRQKDDFGGRSNNSEPFESSVSVALV